MNLITIKQENFIVTIVDSCKVREWWIILLEIVNVDLLGRNTSWHKTDATIITTNFMI